MHSPKILFLVGVLAFVASMAWMYSEDRRRAPDVTPAAPATTSPEETIEPSSATGPSVNSAPTTMDVQPGQQARMQARRIAQTADNHKRDGNRVPAYQASRTTPPEPEVEMEAADPAAIFSISGRVLGPGGKPVSGIRLTARHRSGATGPRDNEAHEARSNATGDYDISGLMQGEYDVRTAATEEYPAAGAQFRAGMRSADIVLTDNQTVQIVGRVTDTVGLPLADVEVKPSGTDPVTVWSDAAGNFRTQAPSGRAGTSSSVTFRLEGYLEERAYVSHSDMNASGETRLDVQLLSLDGTAKVSGVLRGADGVAVVGETVQLDSPSLDNRYRETSQPDGSFSFPAVEPGGDYRLTVHPRSAYESYYQQAIDIQPPSASLSATLQPLDTGRLTGRMIDSEGKPMGGFSMTLRSNKSQGSYVDFSGDDSGYFTVENAPAGNLIFATRSQPQFTVSGITLQPGSSIETELVIDWGDNEFSGRLRDSSRRPVSGASVQLSGRYVGRGIQSSSLRRATTDAEGYFRFSELGSGMHTLSVRMNGFETATQAVDTGSHLGEVEIKLTELSD